MLLLYWFLNFNMKNIIFITLLFFQLSQAQQYELDSDKSFITYSGSHPLHDWQGTSNDVKGIFIFQEETPSRIAVSTSVASFNSKNSSRDAHSLEILNAINFPKVTFYSDQISMSEKFVSFKGKLSLHGVSIDFGTEGEIIFEKDVVVLRGNFEVNPSDFGIKLPSFMLVKMKDELSLKYNLRFKMN